MTLKTCNAAPICIASVICMLLLYAALLRFDGVSGQSSLPAKQADAFLAGQTYLLDAPPAELVNDPSQRLLQSCKAKPRFIEYTDRIVWGEHFYLPYGPVPVLLGFAPYKFFTGKDLSVAAASLAFACLGTMTVLLLCVKLLSMLAIPPQLMPRYVPYLLIIGTFIPVTLSWPEHYQMYIMAAYAFMALGLLSFCHALERQEARARNGYFALLSLCIGLAAGCRFNFVFAGLVPGIYALYLLHRERNSAAVKSAACLLLPLAACVLGLLYYNVVRFGSPFESGVHNQISCRTTIGTLGMFSREFVPYNLYFYLLHPIPPDWSPMLFKTAGAYKSEFRVPWQTSFDFKTQEPVYGLINAPFLLFAFASLKWLRPPYRSGEAGGRWVLAALWLIPLVVFPVMLFMSATMRYAVDFTPWLMLAACAGYGLLARQYMADPKSLRRLKIIGAVAAFYTLATNLSYGLQGYL